MAFSKLLKWLDATKDAVANKVALRGASGECSFGALTVTSGSFSGNVAVGGTLAVTGDAMFGTIASVTSLTVATAGIVDLSGTTLDYQEGTFATLDATGNATVGGDLAVTGTITGTLTNAAVAAAIAEDPEAVRESAEINGLRYLTSATIYADDSAAATAGIDNGLPYKAPAGAVAWQSTYLDQTEFWAMSEMEFSTPDYDVYPDALAAGCMPMHNSVVYIPGGLGGTGNEWWMAYTPFNAASDQEYENPCIATSTDGLSWEDPAGVTNPLDPWPGSGIWNSDTHLLHIDGTLYLFWRQQVSTTSERLYLRTSTDGSTWTAKVLVWENTLSGSYGTASPQIHKVGSEWWLWGVDYDNGTPFKMHLWKAASIPGTFVHFAECTFSAGITTVWHMTIKPHLGKWVMLGSTTAGGGAPGGPAYFAVSDDGVDWQFGPSALSNFVINDGSLFGNLYKPDFVFDDLDEPRIYLCTSAKWQMGRAQKNLPFAEWDALRNTQMLAASNGYLFGDDFARANETPITSPWTVYSGAANISSELLLAPSAGNNRIITGDYVADCEVGLRIDTVGTDEFYLMFRFNSANGRCYRFGRGAGGVVKLQYVGATIIDIASISLPLAAGDWLWLRGDGTTLSFGKNYTRYWTGTDSNSTAQVKHGIQLAGTSTRISGFYIKE